MANKNILIFIYLSPWRTLRRLRKMSCRRSLGLMHQAQLLRACQWKPISMIGLWSTFALGSWGVLIQWILGGTSWAHLSVPLFRFGYGYTGQLTPWRWTLAGERSDPQRHANYDQHSIHEAAWGDHGCLSGRTTATWKSKLFKLDILTLRACGSDKSQLTNSKSQRSRISKLVADSR